MLRSANGPACGRARRCAATPDRFAIGSETSIQDYCALHLDEGFPLTVGNRVTVGHSVTLHGCTIEDDSLIGIGATVLNGAKIGEGSVVAAGSLVPEGMDRAAVDVGDGRSGEAARAVTPEEQARFGKACSTTSRRRMRIGYERDGYGARLGAR